MKNVLMAALTTYMYYTKFNLQIAHFTYVRRLAYDTLEYWIGYPTSRRVLRAFLLAFFVAPLIISFFFNVIYLRCTKQELYSALLYY